MKRGWLYGERLIISSLFTFRTSIPTVSFSFSYSFYSHLNFLYFSPDHLPRMLLFTHQMTDLSRGERHFFILRHFVLAHKCTGPKSWSLHFHLYRLCSPNHFIDQGGKHRVFISLIGRWVLTKGRHKRLNIKARLKQQLSWKNSDTKNVKTSFLRLVRLMLHYH